jgi:putative oxidoreductase
LQRLFTTFAEGWPGLGLLVQRLVTGIALLHNQAILSGDTITATISAPQAMAAVLALFIMTGLWTPLAGVLIAAFELWSAFFYTGDVWAVLPLIALGGTLAAIGPGAFSVDARLFGRKHIGC